MNVKNLESAINLSLMMADYVEDFKEWVEQHEYDIEAHHEFEDDWNNELCPEEVSAVGLQEENIMKFKARIEFSKNNGIFYMWVYKSNTNDLIYSIHLDHGIVDIKVVPVNFK